MPRILCIDDNRHGLFARQSVLEEQGYRVVLAHNGKEGLEKFREQRIDLVIVDYMMPEMNGAEVIRQIRKMSPRIPIILLSGFTERLALEEKVTEADAVLQKGPREVKELLENASRLLQRRFKKPAARIRARLRKTRGRRR